jgi:hypothetical protein
MDVGFGHADAWNGGYYELAIELGPRSDERLAAAHAAIWRYPSIEGCYAERHVEPEAQARLTPDSKDLVGGEYGGGYLGIATLPDGKRLPAGTFIVRENGGPDWLGFFVPMGAMALAYRDVGAFPFIAPETGTRAWREPLDTWLADLGQAVFRSVRFDLGLIGWEMSGRYYARDIAAQGIPNRRYVGCLWPGDAGLLWFPVTEWRHAYLLPEDD